MKDEENGDRRKRVEGRDRLLRMAPAYICFRFSLRFHPSSFNLSQILPQRLAQFQGKKGHSSVVTHK